MGRFLYPIFAVGIILGTSVSAQIGMTGRIAYTCDGNIHDNDDWGATPWSMALFHAFGRTGAVVQFDYSNHIGVSTSEGEIQMDSSALGGSKNFGINPTKVFCDVRNLQAGIANFKAEGNKSSATDPLLFIQGGPMEVAYQCLSAVDLDKRKYITFVSHSGWNNDHVHGICAHTWSDLKALPGGAKFIDISDQNTNLGTGTAGKWDALKTMGPQYQWLFTRQQHKPGDVSDAGMVWYALTGQQNGTPDQIIAKFKSAPTSELSIRPGAQGRLYAYRENGGLSMGLPFTGVHTGISVSDLSGRYLASTVSKRAGRPSVTMITAIRNLK